MNNETRLINLQNRSRMTDAASLTRPFAIRYEPPEVGEPVGIDLISPAIRQYFCIHGIPYLMPCRRCSK